jgi:hypothetical protein
MADLCSKDRQRAVMIGRQLLEAVVRRRFPTNVCSSTLSSGSKPQDRQIIDRHQLSQADRGLPPRLAERQSETQGGRTIAHLLTNGAVFHAKELERGSIIITERGALTAMDSERSSLCHHQRRISEAVVKSTWSFREREGILQPTIRDLGLTSYCRKCRT